MHETHVRLAQSVVNVIQRTMRHRNSLISRCIELVITYQSSSILRPPPVCTCVHKKGPGWRVCARAQARVWNLRATRWSRQCYSSPQCDTVDRRKRGRQYSVVAAAADTVAAPPVVVFPSENLEWSFYCDPLHFHPRTEGWSTHAGCVSRCPGTLCVQCHAVETGRHVWVDPGVTWSKALQRITWWITCIVHLHDFYAAFGKEMSSWE